MIVHLKGFLNAYTTIRKPFSQISFGTCHIIVVCCMIDVIVVIGRLCEVGEIDGRKN